jgi:hypothetical protein
MDHMSRNAFALYVRVATTYRGCVGQHSWLQASDKITYRTIGRFLVLPRCTSTIRAGQTKPYSTAGQI